MRRPVAVAVLVALLGAGLLLFATADSPGRRLIFYARNMECLDRPSDGGVAAIGDSITAGTGEPDWGFHGEDSWFAQSVCNLGVPYGYNAAVPNHTTEQVAEDLAGLLGRDPDVVVVLAGTNDVLQDRPAAEAASKLGMIVARVRAAGARPVIGTVPPFDRNPQGAAALNRELRRLARARDVPVIDFYSVLVGEGGRYRPGLSRDGLHPSEAGAEAMAKVAAPVLRRVAD